MQIIWMLYTPKSARDKGTLYQLRNVLDRKNVVSNPKKDFHACHDFLQTVVDGYIIAAACTIFKVKSPADITEKMIFPNGKPVDAKTTLSAIEDISATIELRYTKYSTSPISASTDGIFKYSRYLLSLGLLARDFMDSWREGDGTRSMRLWKFLLLHYKQGGHNKYAIEAFRLLARVHVTSTPKAGFVLQWNRFCSTRNGKGHNKPLDLHMEHMNRVVKDDLKSFHTHISAKSVNRVSRCADSVNNIMYKFDEELNVKDALGSHSAPERLNDVHTVANTLLHIKAMEPLNNRCHSQFPAVPEEPFSGVTHNIPMLRSWLDEKRKALAKEIEYYLYKTK